MQSLDSALVSAILDHLGLPEAKPSSDYLDALMTTYTRRVPWESAARIYKRARTAETEACPRWPEEFWHDNLTHGTGGTCFESNYAFYTLLRSLGFDGYLTINNMGETVGCHTAIIISVDGARWMVDAGFPVHLPVPLDSTRKSYRQTRYHMYTASPNGHGYYEIERDRHPSPNCFTLIDRPINEADYRAATITDYGSNGLFLDRVIITRVVDGQVWRFNGDGPPHQLEAYPNGEKMLYHLGDELEIVAKKLGAKFNMNADIIYAALAATA